MPPSQKRITISIPTKTYTFLEQWADREGRGESNLAAFLVMEGVREKEGDTSKVTVDLSSISDQIEQLRTDSAWKALSLSQKALVLLQEYLNLLEKHQDEQGDR
jgi:hypothetical protein